MNHVNTTTLDLGRMSSEFMKPTHPILIVEDDPDDRDLLARACRKAKVETPLYFAVDGDEALAFLNKVGRAPDRPRPAVVLLDSSGSISNQ